METVSALSHEKEKLKTTVEGIMKVYTIPVVLKRVLEVVENERSSIVDLVNVVEHDQALSSRILGAANTAFYGLRRNIKTLPSAAVVLGFNMVKSLAVSVSVFKCVDGVSLNCLRNLWQHSFEVAITSSLIAERTGLVKKEEAFLSGLIHDLGRSILYQIYGEQYVEVSAKGLAGLLIREEAAFGATHSQVGAWFVDKYKFPGECVLALQYHHEPEMCLTNGNAFAKHLTSIVYIADFLASEGKGGSGIDSVPSARHAEIMKSVYLDETGFKEIKEELVGMEDTIKEFYSGCDKN